MSNKRHKCEICGHIKESRIDMVTHLTDDHTFQETTRQLISEIPAEDTYE